MADRIELSELETYLYHSADILRTHVDASDYKMYVFPLLFFKRICDVYDEETEKKKQNLVTHSFSILKRPFTDFPFRRMPLERCTKRH